MWRNPTGETCRVAQFMADPVTSHCLLLHPCMVRISAAPNTAVSVRRISQTTLLPSSYTQQQILEHYLSITLLSYFVINAPRRQNRNKLLQRMPQFCKKNMKVFISYKEHECFNDHT